MLREQTNWFCDGTFKVSPRLFCQLYTIHVDLNNQTIPVLYALLPYKTKEIYYNLFTIVKSFIPEANPNRIVVDFEQIVIKSLSSIFPYSTVNGCYFHLTQSVWRRIQSNGQVLNRYKNDIQFSLFIRMILSLAFIPIDDVQISFYLLTTSDYIISNFQDFCDILSYFEENYIGIMNDNDNKPPRFPIPLWNVYVPTLNNMARTNNGVEGWHSGFMKSVKCSHPTLYKFINFLRMDENFQSLKISQIESGHTSRNKKKKYSDLDARLQSIVRNYTIHSVMNYLENIAKNLSL